MDELKALLENVSDSYDDFVRGIMAEVKNYPEKLDELVEYIRSHSEANSSDIGEWTAINIQGIDLDNPPKLEIIDDE